MDVELDENGNVNHDINIFSLLLLGKLGELLSWQYKENKTGNK